LETSAKDRPVKAEVAEAVDEDVDALITSMVSKGLFNGNGNGKRNGNGKGKRDGGPAGKTQGTKPQVDDDEITSLLSGLNTKLGKKNGSTGAPALKKKLEAHESRPPGLPRGGGPRSGDKPCFAKKVGVKKPPTARSGDSAPKLKLKKRNNG
jgi:hypothetical protein